MRLGGGAATTKVTEAAPVRQPPPRARVSFVDPWRYPGWSRVDGQRNLAAVECTMTGYLLQDDAAGVRVGFALADDAGVWWVLDSWFLPRGCVTSTTRLED